MNRTHHHLDSFERPRPSGIGFCRKAFSLIEILVSIGIVAVLAGTVVGVSQKAMKKGAMAQDLAAGKTLGAAYQAYAAENNGELMVGYQKGAPAVDLPDGGKIFGEAANRYVWRLAKYFDFNMNGVIYGKNRVIARVESSQANQTGYGQSIAIPYGMNAFYVGGYIEDGSWAVPATEVATRISQVSKASSLLVFATARSDQGEGNFIVKAPRFVPRAPGSAPLPNPDWPLNETAAGTGNLDFRHENRALCVFLDGSVRSYSVAELKDMRLWSKNAAATDNQDYAPTLESGSGGGGRGGR